MTTFLTSTSLFAPLDAARFALAYLILALAPGYTLASLLRPGAPRITRLAVAIPCAYALVAVVGLATALLRLPFDLLSYGALAIPVTLVGVYTRLSRRRLPTGTAGFQPADAVPSGALPLSRASNTRDLTSAEGRWWRAPVVVSLAQLAAIVLVYARDVMPAGYDTLSHVQWTTDIARTHIFPIAMMSARMGANDGGFYPPVFHALTALVLDAAPMPVYRAVFLSVVAAIAFLPVALYAYVRVATGSARIAGLATIASLAFEPLPLFIQGVGLYPFLCSLLIVPALALALRDGLGDGDRRAVVLAALLGVGLFYTHPTEFVTAGLLALAIVPGLLRTWRAWRRACGYGLAVAAVWLVAAFPALLAVHRTMVYGAQAEIQTKHDFTRAAQPHLSAAIDNYLVWFCGRNESYALLAVTVIGLAWCLWRRRFLGLVVAQLILSLVFLDSISLNLLRPFYVLSFPWALWERLAATHYWTALPLAAIGIDATARALRRPLHGKTPLFVVTVASPFILLGLLLPFGVAAGRAAAYARARYIVAPTDLSALAWLGRHTATGAVVVNEGDLTHTDVGDVPIDAGRWMPALDGQRPLFWRAGDGPGSLPDRFYLLQHIADNPLPPHAALFTERYRVGYVFYGAAILPEARRRLNLARLLADPGLRLVYSSAPTCPVVGAREACPRAGSYVFALTGTEHVRGQIARISHVPH